MTLVHEFEQVFRMHNHVSDFTLKCRKFTNLAVISKLINLYLKIIYWN